MTTARREFSCFQSSKPESESTTSRGKVSREESSRADHREANCTQPAKEGESQAINLTEERVREANSNRARMTERRRTDGQTGLDEQGREDK